LRELELSFDADTQLIEGNNGADVLKVLNEVVPSGFRLDRLILYYFKFNVGETLREKYGGLGVFANAVAWIEHCNSCLRGRSLELSASSCSSSSSNDDSNDVECMFIAGFLVLVYYLFTLQLIFRCTC